MSTFDGEAEFLYRVRDGFVCVLCVPLDGAVARFEKGREAAQNLSFLLRREFDFARPSAERLEQARQELEEVWRIAAKPIAGVHIRTVLGYVTAVALIMVVVLGALNLNQVVEWLLESGFVVMGVSAASKAKAERERSEQMRQVTNLAWQATSAPGYAIATQPVPPPAHSTQMAEQPSLFCPVCGQRSSSRFCPQDGAEMKVLGGGP